MKQKILSFIKREAVLIISLAAALAAVITARPSFSDIARSVDLNVLELLFCLMLVVAGLKECGVFPVLSEKVLSKASGARMLAASMCILSFFIAMLLTNDVALIALVPFTLLLMKSRPNAMLFTVILQTAAANIGSMLTPFGNPQNLYIYTNMNIPARDFFSLTAPVAATGLLLILLLTLLIKNEPVSSVDGSCGELKNPRYIVFFLILFVLCVLAVFKVIPHSIAFASALLVGAILNFKLFGKIDYCLLLTFVCFFVFSSTVTSLPAVSTFLSETVAHNELLTAALTSQIISNVPAAILLAPFSRNTAALLLGVNVGGLGTLIASLASLISFKLYCAEKDVSPARYLLVFSAVNFGALPVLYVLSMLLVA